MKKMLAAQVTKPGTPFELVERDVPQPGPGQVRVKVLACGVCHSDVVVRENIWPGIQFPRIPGHEVAGIIDEASPEAALDWQPGQRVGIGWHGGQCNRCIPCRRGDFANCIRLKITGASYDGGYAQYMVAPVEALAHMPDDLSPEDAGPLLCAGITTFNALRHSGAGPGDLVAVQGVGGLGHLGIQFANKFGFHVVAIGRGPENADLAAKLGAHRYLDSNAVDAAKELTKMGGARAILSTVPNGKAMSGLINGLGANGTMMVVGAGPEAIEVTPAQLIQGRKGIQGWPSGTPADSEDTLRFAKLTGVRAMIEKYPLSKVNEAYDRMMSGKVQFRAVLTMPS
ncbi:MAG TPA: alcohol dehydrogenase [Terriglobales bacterium]|nr:alcohol dehydrogenase [Terriglobales bacterium]